MKRETYNTVKEVARTYNLHMSELLEQAITAWLKEQVRNG